MDPILLIGLANVVAKMVMDYMNRNPNATEEEVKAHIAENLPLIQASIKTIQEEIEKYGGATTAAPLVSGNSQEPVPWE